MMGQAGQAEGRRAGDKSSYAAGMQSELRTRRKKDLLRV